MKIRITNLKARLLVHPDPAYLIAARAGIPPTTLSKFARGVKEMSLWHRHALAEVLECEPDELMGDQEYELTSFAGEGSHS